METHDRYGMTKRLVKKEARRSVDIGSGPICVADFRLDINRNVFPPPDVVCDVRYLPLLSNTFDMVYFLDVIEHIPKGTETKALKEIHRILSKDGELILSTPSENRKIYSLLDVAHWVEGHRHYKSERIRQLVESTNFRIVTMVTAGGLWQCLKWLWLHLLVYPLMRVFKLFNPLLEPYDARMRARIYRFLPTFIKSKVDDEYNIMKEDGYTIFIKANKKTGRP